jgi:adenosylhomocysteine nucleosidase
MAKIGIIAALDVEINDLIKDFNAEPVNDYIYKGGFSGHEIYLTLCGIGKVNSALCTQRIIDYANPDYIINSGIAGAVSKDLKLLDTVISEKLVYHDFYPVELLKTYFPHCSEFEADKKLVKLAWEACEKFARENKDFSFKKGIIASGDMFVNSSEYNKKLDEEFGASCVEMEGAAVAHTAHANKKPFLVLRTVSDGADDEAEKVYDEFFALAAQRSVYLVKDIIANI